MITSKPFVISTVRVNNGLSMRQLAAKSSVNVATISIIESRPKSVTPGTAKRVCDALGVDMSELFEINLKQS